MSRSERRPPAPRPKQKSSAPIRAAQAVPGSRLRTITIGTAGHVDHGKSALVRALTGIDPDRLPEEQARGMTIVLGFAPLPLPSGRLVNIVDVPGHEQLVRTMASGVCGMEAVLLCIDCREGVMPQTREHLDVLELLGIRVGMVVITKADLIEDPAQRKLAEDAVRANLRGTILQDAVVVWTSSRTREGLSTLTDVLDALIANHPARSESTPVRMPIDRTFTVKGFGCVVTGPLLQGTVRVDQQLMLLPANTPVRVRGIQIQHQDADDARAGERPALNIAGVETEAIPPGSVLADPRAFDTTTRILAELTLLPRARQIGRQTELEFLIGTAMVPGQARIHSPGRRLGSGETATAELLCRAPLVCVHGDLILVRDVSTNTTIGRARVLDPHPPDKIVRETVAALQPAATPTTAATTLVAGTGSDGLPQRALAHKIGALPQTLPSVVHTSKTYWLQDEIARAREALIDTMPGPGESLVLTDWWAKSPVQDLKILARLTTQIAYSFHLRREGDRIICPSREAAPPPALPHAPKPPIVTRRINFTSLALARVASAVRNTPIISLQATAPVARLSLTQTRGAIVALCETGRLIRLNRDYAIHADALEHAKQRITFPTTDGHVAHLLRLSHAQAHALVAYLVRTNGKPASKATR